MYGMNDNQNYFTDGKRTTSRVTSEPGGKSTVKLGWDSPKAKEPKPSNEGTAGKKETHVKVEGASATTTTASASSATKRKMSDRSTGSGMSTDSSSSHSHSGRGISSNAYANGASQNTGNVITDRPTSRVTQPPGGVSSISFC